jgi:sortase A
VETFLVTEEPAVLPDGTIIAPDPEAVDSGTFEAAERLALQVEAKPELHQSFALIRIPKIDRLEEGWNVVQGVTRRDLKTGAGHMPHTPLPGQPGNSVISGHRTTYGAPFHELDVLEPGDTIEVETALGTHVYQVRETFIVKPKDVWVIDALPGSWLTLTTCHPKFSARRRLIVRAELIDGPNFAVIQQIGSRL